ncbi:uncharacterized protein LOC118013216 isoform X3 [Mirounga leonina]|uniref:uncharacterized protein LOC118013216 isoform X3 n=1 Tax=Mirounga leonina TaxID=9715 RepID=UPI00156C0A3C|nr:uncharacterized protein LOC118013216 isoform X3 [Mirounga leonina]
MIFRNRWPKEQRMGWEGNRRRERSSIFIWAFHFLCSKVVEHLSDEFQEVVRERQNFLDRALGHLQYQRELSRLHLLHTQIVASGSPACLENYPGDRFYGMIPTSLRARAAACPLLIPFLKSLTAALVGAQGRGPGQEDQGPGTNADKADIMWTSPLFSTLEKVDIWSQAPKEEAELQGQAPEITLQIASRLPAMDASDNAFQGSFFYQSTENTLFVGRESLASAGSFILLLIHCLAHIATEDFRQDANPAFLRSFYKGLRAYFGEAFSTTLRVSAISWDSKLDQSISATLRDEQPISERGRDLLFLLLERKCESCLEPESSEEYRKRNTDLLLFTSMEHFLKSLLPAEQQIPRKARDQHGDEEKRCDVACQGQDHQLAPQRNN